MAAMTRIAVLLLLLVPVTTSFSWVPVSPDQSFPLPEPHSPEILPDPGDGFPATSSNTSSALQTRWISPFVNGGTSGPWPIRGILKKRNRVRYCYATAEMKEKIGCRLREAIALWDKALGGGASKGTGHNLAFSEVTFAGKTQLCFKEFYYSHWNGNRNRLVSDDVLAIYWKDTALSGGVSAGTVGYTPKEHTDPNFIGLRHSLTLADNADPAVIAHEIGHVLGLEHEMKRQDRDEYVEFRCLKLQGFAVALIAAQSKPENRGISIQDLSSKLCTDAAFAHENGFLSEEYIKTADKHDGDGEFDVDSIMMYASTTLATQACMGDLNQCPLVRIKKQNGVKVGVEPIQPPMHPSEGDVAFVRKYYPWKG